MGTVKWMTHAPNQKHIGRHIIWTFLSRRRIEKEIEALTEQETLDGQELEDEAKLEEDKSD